MSCSFPAKVEVVEQLGSEILPRVTVARVLPETLAEFRYGRTIR